MTMRVMLVDERKKPFQGPYVLRLGGWTLERYLAEAPDNQLWEFVRGEVVMYSPATAEHQDLAGFLYRLLAGYCEAKGWGKVLMGPAAIQILPDVIREPDLFVLPPEEVPKARGVPLVVQPALVVEVVSPSTRVIDLKEKPDDYASAGIPEYWAIDPDHKEFFVHRLRGDEYEVDRVTARKVKSSSVPGLWLDTGWIFRTPFPQVTDCLEKVVRGGEGG